PAAPISSAPTHPGSGRATARRDGRTARPPDGPAAGQGGRTWEDRKWRTGAAHPVTPQPYAQGRVRTAYRGAKHGGTPLSRLRWLTAGESHGPALVATLEGLPAGVPITTDMVADHLARRRLGYGRGARMSFERDEVTFLGGVRHGLTLGSPVAIMVGNTEWPKWEKVMAADPVDPAELAGLARNAPLTRPRPGHADLAGMQKYGWRDARPVLERASARETAARVALGTVAKALLDQGLNVQIVSHVIALGPVEVKPGLVPRPEDAERIDADPLRCLDPEASAAMVAEVDAAKKDADTLGGVVEVLAYGVPPGLGSHVHWDRKLDARLAAALMSIQAIKGVEIGDGFTQARSRGSAAHDEIMPTPDGVRRVTDRAGGL